MAADLGELLVPYMPTIRVPRTGDRVFKSECAFSFDSPESEGGLYVCMNTFLGFGREHVERHYRKTGQSVYMHLKRHVKEKATGAAGGAIPRRRNGKVFLDLELNRDFNGEDYEYEDEAKLVIFPDHFEIPLPNIEELPALVTIACDAVLNAPSAYKKQEPESWEEEIQVSRHARSLRQLDNGVRIPPSGWKCQKCEMRENLWLNLTDGAVLCGKWFFDGSGGNGHALEHYRETNYPLAVKLDTITPDGADVYSFEEEEAVLDPHISEHLSHFGIDMLQMQKRTENGHHTDNNPRPRVSEWEVIQESGMKLKEVYGSGYTGIKNLGNSCYLSTVMQVLFSIPDFQRMYVGNLQRIYDYSPLDPTQDFATQMAKLGHGLLSGQYSKPPMKSELIEQVMKEEYKHQQKGISARMLKSLVSRGHPEFSSNRQQDAHEFILHMINLVERNSAGSENPSDVFRFLVEERVQCCQTRRVRYTQRVDYCIQLPAPFEAATNREELLAYEAKCKEAEENMRPPPEPVRARIPFTACLQAFTEPENVPDFWSSALQAKSAGVKTSRFASFPEYLVLQIKKFTFGVDWVPKKLDLGIDVPDFLDLSRLRATGLQAGEEELPDLMPPIVLPEDTRADVKYRASRNVSSSKCKAGFEQDIEGDHLFHPDSCRADVLATTRNQESAADSAYGVRRPPEMEQRAGANVHYTLLIACVLVAFFLGAILSGFLVSCYCSRSAAHRARRLGKDPEASLPHALSLRSLAKLNGLLDGQPKEDKLDVSTPKMYSSFIPNGRAEHHLHSPAHQGLPLGDPELSLSQGDGELSGLPTPDSTPELPIKNMKALRHHQYEKNQNCNNAKDKPKSGPSCSGSSLGFMAVVGNSLTQQVFPFSHHHSNSLSNGAAHGAGASSTSLHLPEERKISNDERAAAAAGGAGVIPHHHHSQQSLPQTVVDVSALDELLKHIHEVSASGTGGIKVLTSTSSSSLFPGPSSSSGGHHHNHHHHHHSHHGQTRTHHYNHGHHHSNHHNNNTSGAHQQQIPETASTSYYSTSALPSDGLPKLIEPPPQNSTSSSATSSSSSSSSSNNPTSSTSIPSSSSSSSSTPLQQQVIPERPGVGGGVSVTRHHSQRHSLIKMGSGSGAVPRHHSFNQRGPQHAQFLARMNTNNSSSTNNNNNNNSPAGAGGVENTNGESKQPSVASACLTRQHSYSEGPHVPRAAIVRRTASLKPQIPPKPLFLPNTATSEVAEAGKYNY